MLYNDTVVLKVTGVGFEKVVEGSHGRALNRHGRALNHWLLP